MNKLMMIATIATGLSAFGAEPANQVNWKSSVTTGDYSLGTNWEGDAAPLTAGKTATFALGQASGAYKAAIPAAGLTECAMTYLKAIGPTASLVLNATGTTWTKGAGAYTAADEAFRVVDGSTTVLNLSNVDTTGATGVFTLTDGKLAYDGATKTFSVDGAWNLGSTTINLGSVATAQVVFNAGSAVTGKALNVNGSTPLVINGGTHTFAGNVYIGAGSWANSKMRILGGSSKFSGTTYLCGPDTGHSKGELEIGGTASVTLGAVSMSHGYSANGQVARIRTTGTGTVSFSGQCQTRHTNGGSAAEFIAEGNSTLNMPSSTDYLTSGQMRCALTVVATNNATMAMNYMTPFYSDSDVPAASRINFFGHSTALVPSGKEVYFSFHNGSGTVRTNCFMVAEDATMRVQGTLYLGQYFNNCFGLLLLKDRAKLVVEPAGVLSVGRAAGNDAGLLVRDSATVIASNNVSIARAKGVIDMEGGTMTVKGFTFSGTASATRPALLANGSTIRPVVANATFLTGFSRAEISGAGLVLDDTGLDLGVSQAFTGTTFTKVGAGTMSVGTASTHDTTVVAGGTLAFGSGVTTFGNALVVTNGAVVSTVGDSAGLALTTLTLGDATTAGTLMIDNSDVITLPNDAALTVNAGKIVLSDPLTIGDVGFLKVTSGTISAAKLEKLTIANASITREYEFNVVADGDGAKIVLTIAEVSTHEQTWTGATDASWETATNWDPAKKPTSSSALTFPSDAARKDIAVASAAQAQSVVIDGEYSFGGAGSLLLPNLELKDGASATFDLPVEVPTGLTPVTPDGTALAFNGAITCPALYGITFAGSRSFRVAGDNEDFLGSWNFNAVTGRVTFAGANAAGVATKNETLQLGPGTITTEGEDEIVVNQTTTLAPGANTNVSILDTDAPTTFANGLTVSSGAFVKTGVGTMTAYFSSADKRYIARATPDTGRVGRGAYLPIALPASGSGVTAGTGLSGVNILEGRLVLDGVSGAQVSDNNQYSAIGGNYSNGTANAVLHVKRISLTSGQHDNYTVIGSFPVEGAMDRPTAIVTDGATWEVGELALGAGYYGRNTPYYPTLAVTNAEVKCNAALHIGSYRWCQAPCIHPVVRIGPGGKVGQYKNGYPNIFRVSQNVDVLVDGGELYDYGGVTLGGGEVANKDCVKVEENNYYSGTFRFVNGGKFSICSLKSGVTLADKSLKTDFIFDGGILKLKSTDRSSVADVQNVAFEVGVNGMEVQVSNGIVHEFAIQLAGAGAVTKTGAGTLVLTNTAKVAVLDSTVKNYTGAFTVAEGVVDFGGQDISGFASLGGAGTVKNATCGTLTLAVTSGSAPVLDGIGLNRLKVDFASFGGTLKKGDVLTVAKLANGATVGRFKALNVGERLTARFAVEANGDVVATVGDKDGFSITVR